MFVLKSNKDYDYDIYLSIYLSIYLLTAYLFRINSPSLCLPHFSACHLSVSRLLSCSSITVSRLASRRRSDVCSEKARSSPTWRKWRKWRALEPCVCFLLENLKRSSLEGLRPCLKDLESSHQRLAREFSLSPSFMQSTSSVGSAI